MKSSNWIHVILLLICAFTCILCNSGKMVAPNSNWTHVTTRNISSDTLCFLCGDSLIDQLVLNPRQDRNSIDSVLEVGFINCSEFTAPEGRMISVSANGMWEVYSVNQASLGSWKRDSALLESRLSSVCEMDSGIFVENDAYTYGSCGLFFVRSGSVVKNISFYQGEFTTPRFNCPLLVHILSQNPNWVGK